EVGISATPPGIIRIESTIDGVDHGSLFAAVDARHSPADSRADLHVRRTALNVALFGLQNDEPNKKGGPFEAAFSVSFRLRHQPPLPPITARTVSSGPKSSAPST